MTTSWKGKRVLVTGGTGFIGSFLVEALLERGALVRVPIRAQNYRALSARRGEIDWLEGDLRDPDYCMRLLAGVDTVFHLASHRRNSEFHRKNCSDVMIGNIEMTAALLHAIKDAHIKRAVFFSTANVPPSMDVIALAQQPVIDGYTVGKAMCETLWFASAKQHNYQLLNVRPVGVYGERDTFSVEGNVIPALMMKAREKDVLKVWGSGNQKLRFLYVHDLITAVMALLDAEALGIQYITPPELITVASLAQDIADIVRPGIPIEFDASKPDGKLAVAALPMHPVLETIKWTPLKKGLQSTYQAWNNSHTDC